MAFSWQQNSTIFVWTHILYAKAATHSSHSVYVFAWKYPRKWYPKLRFRKVSHQNRNQIIETLYDIDSTNRGSASEIACRLHTQHGCTSTSTTDWNIIGSVIMIDKLNITNEWISFTRIISTIMEKPSD